MRRAAVEISSTRSSSESATAGPRTFVPSRRLSHTRCAPEMWMSRMSGSSSNGWRRASPWMRSSTAAVTFASVASSRGSRPSAYAEAASLRSSSVTSLRASARSSAGENRPRPASSCATCAAVNASPTLWCRSATSAGSTPSRCHGSEPFSSVVMTPPPRWSARAAPNSARRQGRSRHERAGNGPDGNGSRPPAALPRRRGRSVAGR